MRVAEGLLLPVRLGRSPLGSPALHIQLRDPDSGALLATWPVHPPPVLERAYTDAVAGLGATLVAREGSVQVAVSAWFVGPHAPPRGAGGFDLVIDL